MIPTGETRYLNGKYAVKVLKQIIIYGTMPVYGVQALEDLMLGGVKERKGIHFTTAAICLHKKKKELQKGDKSEGKSEEA